MTDKDIIEVAARALEPFAEQASRYDPDEDDGDQMAWDSRFTVTHLRNAREALAMLSAAQHP